MIVLGDGDGDGDGKILVSLFVFFSSFCSSLRPFCLHFILLFS